LLAEHLGDVGAVMRRAEHAPGPVVLDLPGHQLLRVVGALGRGEFGHGGIRAAGGEMLPVEQSARWLMEAMRSGVAVWRFIGGLEAWV
jgi:hypothetical protein